MATTKISQRDHTNAVIAALKAPAAGRWTVGDGIRNSEPDGTGQDLPPPVMVVHPLPGGSRYGTLDDVGRHATLVYQISCHGITRDQCEWLRDQTELLLDGITVPGRTIDVVRADFGSTEARRDDAVGAPWFTAHPRYRITSLA